MRLIDLLIDLLPDPLRIRFSKLDKDEEVMLKLTRECKDNLKRGYKFGFNKKWRRLKDEVEVYGGNFKGYFTDKIKELKDIGRDSAGY